MEVQEALKMLDNVCAGYQGTRADHVAMQQALQVVTKALIAIIEAEKEVKKKESDGNK